VEAVLKEGIQGIGEEIVDLRMMGRELLERQGQAKNSQEAAILGEAYTLVAFRIGEMIKAEKELAESEKTNKTSKWAEDVLAMLDRAAIATGGEPVSDQARKEAMEGEPSLDVASRRLAEEIASLRYLLRNVFRLASEAQETRELVRFVEIYSSGCTRLVRLLKIERSNTGQLEEYLRECFDKALDQTVKELGLKL
jgi:hypothetical protein